MTGGTSTALLSLINTIDRNEYDISLLLYTNDGAHFDEIPTFKKPSITKRKKYDLYPMSEQEAIEQLELVDNSFYVFLNQETQGVCVAYRRDDGDFGIIETNI